MKQKPDGNSEAAISGLVIKTQSGFFTVQTTEGLVVCQLRGTLKQASKKTELCVIGDHVLVERLPDGTGAIAAVLPRERVLSRVEPSEYAGTATEREQVLIAHLDQAIFVLAASSPTPNPRFLDRLLVAAEKAAIPDIVIVVNKMDMPDIDNARQLFSVYENIGYPVQYMSARAEKGIDALRDLLTGKISIFTGPSGVGKTSLLNLIQPGLGRAVGEISRKLTKGRHTTVTAELIVLDSGGYVADTPGIRSMAPWDVEPGELDAYFREFAAFVPDCQFSDCTHVAEPGCAVRCGVNEGHIAPTRYDSYLRLREELATQYFVY